MRSFLLISGLLAAVAIAFVLGVFVGVRERGPAPQAPQIARAETAGADGGAAGDGQASGTTGSTGSASPGGASSGGGKAGSGRESANGGGNDEGGSAAATGSAGSGAASGTSGGGGTGGGNATGSGGTGSGGAGSSGGTQEPASGGGSGKDGGGKSGTGNTWLTEAVPAPANTRAAGGGQSAAKPQQPTVLTKAKTAADAPVYAVQTVDPMSRSRALDLARRLGGDRYTARIIPVFAGSGERDGTFRSHVRLGVFANRGAAETAARQSMRRVDARLRVLRVARPPGAAGGKKGDAAASADQSAPDAGTAANQEGSSS